MAERKRTKEQRTIYKTLHRKLKVEQHELKCSRRVSITSSTNGTCSKSGGHELGKVPECDHDEENIHICDHL